MTNLHLEPKRTAGQKVADGLRAFATRFRRTQREGIQEGNIERTGETKTQPAKPIDKETPVTQIEVTEMTVRLAQLMRAALDTREPGCIERFFEILHRAQTRLIGNDGYAVTNYVDVSAKVPYYPNKQDHELTVRFIENLTNQVKSGYLQTAAPLEVYGFMLGVFRSFHMIHYHIRHEWYDTIPNEIEILRRYNKDNPGKRAVMEVTKTIDLLYEIAKDPRNIQCIFNANTIVKEEFMKLDPEVRHKHFEGFMGREMPR
ncbi:MAG: hypothetical protein AABX38_05710 [Candidatus Micrarchaeota archaeon]